MDPFNYFFDNFYIFLSRLASVFASSFPGLHADSPTTCYANLTQAYHLKCFYVEHYFGTIGTVAWKNGKFFKKIVGGL